MTVAESKTGGIIYAVGGSAEVGIIMMGELELSNIFTWNILKLCGGSKSIQLVCCMFMQCQVGGAGHTDMEQLEPGVIGSFSSKNAKKTLN